MPLSIMVLVSSSMNSGTRRSFDDLIDDFLRQPLAAGLPQRSSRHAVSHQAAEVENAHVRTAKPGWNKFRAKHENQRNCQRQGTRWISKSSNSRVLGSLQCMSSSAIGAGWRVKQPLHLHQHAREASSPSAFAGSEQERGIAVTLWDSRRIGEQRRSLGRGRWSRARAPPRVW